MAHLQQKEFCQSVKDKFPQHFKNVLALDIGALDINGNNQFLFDGGLYLGVDVALGRNVDIISKGHELALPDATFDIIISTECFEHDQHYRETLRNIYRMLKPGGMFLFTCATTGRPEHGTRRTTPSDAPLLQSFEDWSDYYKNLTEADIRDIFNIEAEFSDFHFSIGEETHDLYFYGTKKGEKIRRTDYSFISRQNEIAKAFSDMESNLKNMQSVIISLEVDSREKQSANEQLTRRVAEAEAAMRDIYSSRSWKLTAPVRLASRLIKKIFFSLPNEIGRSASSLWRLNVKAMQYCKRHGPLETVRRAKEVLGNKPANQPRKLELKPSSTVYILTTRHCNYIAELIAKNLAMENINASIIYSKPETGFSNDLHFVICPQIFKSLPALYVALQMEQSVSSRWFTPEYINRLNKAIAIFDYSATNIEFLLSKGIPYQKIYYLPIGAFPSYTDHLAQKGYNISSPPNKNIEVLFYGDTRCKRRQAYLNELQKHFDVHIATEIFGEALLQLINQAKIVINIHYYEGALLETTRIYEVLSVGTPVVSESSVDIAQHSTLQEIVDFVETGDIPAMISRIRELLEDDEYLRDRRKKIANFSTNDQQFTHYFRRYLLANDLLPFSRYQRKVDFLPSTLQDIPRLCLTLTETPHRRKDFFAAEHYGFQAVEGIRHTKGWLGCGMSYKYMLQTLCERGMKQMMICEDDVLFPSDFPEKLSKILTYLQQLDRTWHLFSGIIAHLNPDTKILKIEQVDGIEYIYTNRMTSMVMNIYSYEGAELISQWDESIHDPHKNTIDRYIEANPNLVVITTLPFLVGYAEEQQSTLWGFKNTQYKDMIIESERLLQEKVLAYKKKNHSNHVLAHH